MPFIQKLITFDVDLLGTLLRNEKDEKMPVFRKNASVPSSCCG